MQRMNLCVVQNVIPKVCNHDNRVIVMAMQEVVQWEKVHMVNSQCCGFKSGWWHLSHVIHPVSFDTVSVLCYLIKENQFHKNKSKKLSVCFISAVFNSTQFSSVQIGLGVWNRPDSWATPGHPAPLSLCLSLNVSLSLSLFSLSVSAHFYILSPSFSLFLNVFLSFFLSMAWPLQYHNNTQTPRKTWRSITSQ